MKMKRFSFVALICGALCLTSCGAFKSYVASYSVGLSTVESPADAKQQFGETKVVSFNEEGVSKYRYEDDYIDIVWFVGSKQFNFTLKNKSGHTLKINWDDISYVDTKGQVGRVMHAGAKVITKQLKSIKLYLHGLRWMIINQFILLNKASISHTPE